MYNIINVKSSLNRTSGYHGMRSLTYASMLLFSVAATAAVADDKIVDIKVYFNGSCPKTVDLLNVDVDRNPPQKVRWTAYNEDGTAKLTTVSYSIYFDPFVGPTLNSNRDGVITSTPVSSKTPVEAEYKYTIYTDGCTPVDPRIRVR